MVQSINIIMQSMDNSLCVVL